MAIRTALRASTLQLALGVLVSLMSPLAAHSAPGDTTLVSEHYSPPPDNYSVRTKGISADGRFVLFATSGPEFLPNGSNGMQNALVRDRDAGKTFRANVGSNGKAVPDRSLLGPAISADGRYVVFESNLATVVPGDTNNQNDVFLRDLRTQTTELVSVKSDGTQYRFASGGSPSADGRYVAFIADDFDLVRRIHVRDRLTRQTSTLTPKGLAGWPLISADGRYLVYKNFQKLVAFDRTTHIAENVNVSSNGQVANAPCQLAGVSADGRYVLFVSTASNLVSGDTNGAADAFVHDRMLRKTERVTLTNDEKQYANLSSAMVPSLSPDGRFVAFTASTRNVGNYSIDDVLVRDRIAGTTRLASVNSAGVKANGHSSDPVISGGGRFVAFTSEASNLAAGDTNKYPDAFIHEFATPTTSAVPP